MLNIEFGGAMDPYEVGKDMTAGRGWLRRREKTSDRLEPEDLKGQVLSGCEFMENNGEW